MKRILLITTPILLALGIFCWFSKPKSNRTITKKEIENKYKVVEEVDELELNKRRQEYEWKLLHDPRTGEIPRDIKRKEAELLQSIIARQKQINFRTSINNTYNIAGPSQRGGRTRAIAFDMRTNQILLAAGVSGGIFKSSDGGASWTFVHPPNDVRSVTCLAQDPRPGFQNIWYAGTGELIGDSPFYPNAAIPGFGLLKSVDNGSTWFKIESTTISGTRENIDNIWDYVFNVQVDSRGYVYAAVLNHIMRSLDGGDNWSNVIGGNGWTPSEADANFALTEVVVPKNSNKVYVGFSGRNPNRDFVGVWSSSNGDPGSFTRIAGGKNGQTDSVPGWRGYNNKEVSGGRFISGYGRIVLAAAPSNPDILYVMYDNARSSADGVAEVDLFRADLSGSTPVWSANRSNFMRGLRDGPGGTQDYLETQIEYNMLLAVHPTNPDLVLAGGVNLYRSLTGFATAGTFIGGETSSTYDDLGSVSHVDFHSFAFDPTDPNRFVVSNDGGVQVCPNIAAPRISWSNFANLYQTYQYYHVAIDPRPGSLVFAGGAQDNSTSYRDARGLLADVLPDVNDHYTLIGGDGCAVGMNASTSSEQLLYGAAQNGALFRQRISRTNQNRTPITPSAAVNSGEFVTYFHLDPYNTETIYYTSFNKLYRTISASIVSQNAGWIDMFGVGNQVGTNQSIFALATSHGTYANENSYLFIGTNNGRIYRLRDPRNAGSGATPVSILPSTQAGITPESLVRQIAVNPRNPDTVMVVISNYGVASAFWTGNATKSAPTWQAVEGNIALPSFRSCAIVATPTGVEYYVGTSIGLFSTTNIDGANTNWTLEGPPVMRGAIISDLALRASDNTLLIGTHGNGMFYTVINNAATSTPDYVTNDQKFITSIYPTVSTGNLQIQTGTAIGIKNLDIRVLDMNGRTVYTNRRNYGNGPIDLSRLPIGIYSIEIISDNRKYRHVQKIIRE